MSATIIGGEVRKGEERKEEREEGRKEASKQASKQERSYVRPRGKDRRLAAPQDHWSSMIRCEVPRSIARSVALK